MADPVRPDGSASEEEGPKPRQTTTPLARPPSARYSEALRAEDDVRAPAPQGRQPSGVGWAVGIGASAALIPSAVLVALASFLGFTAGLVVAGAFLGRIVGIGVRGSRSGVDSDTRTLVAIVVTLLALAVTQVAIWLLALREGGVLPLVDYLAQTYGPVVPLEAMFATAAAWWSAR